jgi:hypothetical protein
MFDFGQIGPFRSCYIFENELSRFGLPCPDIMCDIMTLVEMASALIDVECGRIDGDGNGSLVYTTYSQRVLMSTRNRNLIQVNAKPLVGIPQAEVDFLIAAASGAPASGNYFYTGVQASTFPQAFSDARLSSFIGASGRYGYTRQDMAMGFPDIHAMINPLNLVTLFGGPAPWTAIDISNMEYDPKTGEVWIPAGLQLQKYSEVFLIYNSGYNPFRIPQMIKHVCASLVKNAMVRANATTALMSMNVPGAGSASWVSDLFDPTLSNALIPFRTVRAI